MLFLAPDLLAITSRVLAGKLVPKALLKSWLDRAFAFLLCALCFVLCAELALSELVRRPIGLFLALLPFFFGQLMLVRFFWFSPLLMLC